MSSIDIDVKGLDEAQHKMAQLIALMTDLRPFWPLVTPLFVGWMRSQFATEGAYAGEPWARLSPAYLAWKTRTHPGKPILQLEGDLRQAASRPSRRATSDTLTLTIVDEKLAYHQEGTPYMPARPLVFDELPTMARIELEHVAEEYVTDMAKRVGLL